LAKMYKVKDPLFFFRTPAVRPQWLALKVAVTSRNAQFAQGNS